MVVAGLRALALLCVFASAASAETAAEAEAETEAAEKEEAPRAAVVAYKSSAQPFSDTIVLRGRTEANRRVEVRSQIAGLIMSEPLRKGATVKSGETLCRLDPGDRVAESTEAGAVLREAQMNAKAATELVRKGYTSETTANTRNAALEAARARVLRADLNLARLTITAPFDGILESDSAELGSLLQNGSTCATLIALDPIKLVAFAPERSVDQLEVGAPMEARLITGREVAGAISFVARSADRDTRTYLIEAETPNRDLTIRDGMTAELTIRLAGESAHLAPQTALTLNNDGVLGVRLADGGVARFSPVQILRDESQGVWISGLPNTAEIIVVGQEFVSDGQPLAVEYADSAQMR